MAERTRAERTGRGFAKFCPICFLQKGAPETRFRSVAWMGLFAWTHSGFSLSSRENCHLAQQCSRPGPNAPRFRTENFTALFLVLVPGENATRRNNSELEIFTVRTIQSRHPSTVAKSSWICVFALFCLLAFMRSMPHTSY